ncbi:Protein EAT-2 [Aphelenchoides avenae]|nr:Protein EAT-2 [Aphelenchus avenae]
MLDISYYVPNGEWELVATPAKRIASGYQDDLFIELYFYLHIRRKVVYYGINWIIPSILFLFSNVLGFSLPAECGEKITLQTTNLLSVTVFLGMVADVTPPTSTSVPVIGTAKAYIIGCELTHLAAFFSISMILLGSSVIFTLLVINVHFRSPKTHKMSPWVRTVFLEWMPWLLLMQRPGKQFSNPKKKDQPSDEVIVHKPLSVRGRSDSSASRLARCENGGSPKIGKLRRRGVVRHAEDGQPILAESEQPTTGREGHSAANEIPLADENKHCRCASCSANLTTLSTVRKTMTELSEYLQASKQRMEEDDEEEEAQADWRFMAMTIDRACLFVYAIVTFMLPIYIFLATPVPAMPKDGNYTTIL